MYSDSTFMLFYVSFSILCLLKEEFGEKPNFINLLDGGFCKQQVKGRMSSLSSPCDDVCLKKLIRWEF